jgi:hypothetical protein
MLGLFLTYNWLLELAVVKLDETCSSVFYFGSCL